MPTNAELVKKADLALSDLATAGRLSPEQTDRFVRTVIDQPTILNRCRVVTMNSPERLINKVGFGSRILRPAQSATALQDSDRVKPDLGQVKLTTKEVIAEIHIPYDVIEDNIERGNTRVAPTAGAGGFHDTIVDMIAERAALDLEELGLKGDVSQSGSDAYIGLLDGWIKKSTANVVNAGAAISKTVLKNAVKAMPDKYLRNRAQMVHFLSVDNETDLRDQYADRTTVLGDNSLTGNLPMYIYGSQIVGVPLMPTETALFTNPLNLIFGIQRDIQIEYDKDIRRRVFIIVLTSRVDFAIEEINAVTKITNITA